MQARFYLNIANLHFTLNAQVEYQILLDQGMIGFVENVAQTGAWQINCHPIENAPKTDLFSCKYSAIQEDKQVLWQIDEDTEGKKLLRCKRADRTILEESHLIFWDDSSKTMEIYSKILEGETNLLEPLAYPVAPLLMHIAIQDQEALILHCSAVVYQGEALVFTGFSGKGKSTMANLWQEDGHTCINDDRIILRFEKGKWWVYNTPMPYEDSSKKAPLKAIFAISHGEENLLLRQNKFEAIQAILPNCIQHGYDKTEIENRFSVIERLCQRIPIYRLPFVPNQNVLSFIKTHVDNI